MKQKKVFRCWQTAPRQVQTDPWETCASVTTYPFVLTQYQHWTNGQTDGQTNLVKQYQYRALHAVHADARLFKRQYRYYHVSWNTRTPSSRSCDVEFVDWNWFPCASRCTRCPTVTRVMSSVLLQRFLITRWMICDLNETKWHERSCLIFDCSIKCWIDLIQNKKLSYRRKTARRV